MPVDTLTVPRTSAPLRWPVEPQTGGWYTDAEKQALLRVVEASLDWRHGWRGPEEEIFEAAFARRTSAAHAVAFNAGGTALEMVLHSLELTDGDEVVSCAVNFVGPHLAVIHQGGRLVLAEPDPLTLNLDPADVERVLSPRTRAILVTHWNGATADIQAFLDLAARNPHPQYGPPVVIVDAARACGATTPAGLPVGKEGWATVFSFERKKLMTTLGQGGMVTTDDEQLAEQLRRLRAYGGTGHWGTKQMLTGAQAAVGLVQLERLDEMLDARIGRAHRRSERLAGIGELTLPPTLHRREHVYYRYNLLVPDAWAGEGRYALMDRLAEQFGVGSMINDRPTYLSHALIRSRTEGQHCPRAEQLTGRLLCPILHPLITESEEEEICEAIRRSTEYLVVARPGT
ncbi:DegT/DnrJ/EryC1/StrS family aminotransferase [Kitasatospora sp. NPDC059088]|uniref:DegT/DnrJ/EryC1/StrS family aminotransferase n=1 Tax=Kitasatospora sp. NPDC059088 TaxID=3346722 RepID=UPI003680E32F